MLLDMSAAEILSSARQAKAQSGRSILRQLADIVRLRRGPGKLTAREYFDYRLFEPALSDDERSTFVGRWARADVYQAQDAQWTGLGNDKLLGYLFLEANGIATPPVKAVYHESRFYPGVALLNTPQRFETWLRDPGNYPFFAKPSAGFWGRDATYAIELDAKADAIMAFGGKRISIPDYTRKNWRRHLGGLIVQEVIRPHPELVERIGNRVATARVLTMRTDDGPRIHRAVYRVPVGANFTDNFNLGSSGNGFASIDVASGTLTALYTGIGLSRRQIDRHLDTGKTLLGYQLPHWQRAVEMVKLGQQALLGLPLLGWDVAFTAAGPLIVEFNTYAGYALLQATGEGLIDREFRRNFPADLAETRRRYPTLEIGAGVQQKRR
jgi:hypothetical protein